MVDLTTYFKWDKPANGGDLGAWGAVLNTVLDAADSDLRATAGLLSEQLNIPASNGFGSPNWFKGGGGYAVHGATSPDPYYIPVGDRLRVGQRITAFSSYGAVQGAKTAQVSLIWTDPVGPGENVISSGHTLPAGTIAQTSTTGLAHDIAANRAYFVKVVVNSGTDQAQINCVNLTLSKTP